jgi:hypothetical protein
MLPNMEEKKEKSLIQQLVEETMEAKPHLTPQDIYSEVPMSKQNFFNLMREEGREVAPESWPKWRKALGLNKKTFWDRAEKHYDPTPGKDDPPKP